MGKIINNFFFWRRSYDVSLFRDSCFRVVSQDAVAAAAVDDDDVVRSLFLAIRRIKNGRPREYQREEPQKILVTFAKIASEDTFSFYGVCGVINSTFIRHPMCTQRYVE